MKLPLEHIRTDGGTVATDILKAMMEQFFADKGVDARQAQQEALADPDRRAVYERGKRLRDDFDGFLEDSQLYKSRLIKRTMPTRKRRTRQEIDAIKDVIYRVLQAENPQTVRQVFYQLAGFHQVIPKMENQYKNTVVRLLKEMRLDGTVPWSWITDSSRSVYQVNTYDSMEQALEDMQRLYRRSLMDAMNRRVEIWIEKDALAGVVMPITEEWGVPLYPAKGYASLTFLHQAAETADNWYSHRKKITKIYYFGDYDPTLSRV